MPFILSYSCQENSLFWLESMREESECVPWLSPSFSLSCFSVSNCREHTFCSAPPSWLNFRNRLTLSFVRAWGTEVSLNDPSQIPTSGTWAEDFEKWRRSGIWGEEEHFRLRLWNGSGHFFCCVKVGSCRWLYCVILFLFIIVGRVGDWGDGLLTYVTGTSELDFKV